MAMKTCRKCEVSKPIEAFWKKKSARDGFQPRCIECMAAYHAARYREDLERRSAQRRAYTAENRDRIYAKNRQYYVDNAARIAAQRKGQRTDNRVLIATKQRQWLVENFDRVREYRRARWAENKMRLSVSRKPYFLDYYRRVKEANPWHFAAKAAERRARILQATPAWADDSKISEFYESAQGLSMLTGEWYHVDHIVPLTSATVCGLHTEANLSVLLGVENISKSNRHWPDQP